MLIKAFNWPFFFPWGWWPTFNEYLSDNDHEWQGYCLVQRIEAAGLRYSSGAVNLTLQAASDSDAYIDRVYISQPNPAGNPYDSAADLTAVATSPFMIPANTAVTIPISLAPTPSLSYTLDRWQPLLIAVDFSSAPNSGVRCKKTVPSQVASAYYKLGAEAASADRGGDFTPYPGVFLVHMIEVKGGYFVALS